MCLPQGLWQNNRIMREGQQAAVFLSADLRRLEPVEVNFNDCLQLAGIGLERDAVGVALRLHWRALRRSTRPWRCFVHVLANGNQISSLDHDILRGSPPVTHWEEGDEGYESLRLWLSEPPDDLKLRLGLYDPEINVRAAVLSSTLSVADESSAVWIEPGKIGDAVCRMQFEAVPLAPCPIVFERGIELAAYSIARCGELVWLRLKWLRRRAQGAHRRRGIRFFGHVVVEQAPETPALVQFDQDLAIESTGPVTAVEQNIVRAVSRPEGAWLRAGVFRPSNGRRLRILRSSVRFDEARRFAYLEFPAGSRS